MTDTAVAPPRPQTIWGRVGDFLVRRPESTIALVALVLGAYFAVVNPAFLTTANIRVISQYMIATAILAAGQVMLLICGEIDLSMGNVYFMTPFLVFFANEAGLVLPLAIVVGVLGAGVVGYLNGAISIGFGIPSFIVTLGMGFVINGFTLNISDGFPKRAPSTGVAAAIFGGANFSGLMWVIIIVIGMHLILNHTRWGVYTVASRGQPARSRRGRCPHPEHQDAQLHRRRDAGRFRRGDRGDPGRLLRPRGGCGRDQGVPGGGCRGDRWHRCSPVGRGPSSVPSSAPWCWPSCKTGSISRG